MGKDPVLEKYESEGFGKNAFGWYFNPWIDEYDEDYDPHNDKEYNHALKENKKQEPKIEKDPVLEKYESEGFGKNAFGWYFNPWIDEYDEDYDPHNDKEYNHALKENKKENINVNSEEIENGNKGKEKDKPENKEQEKDELKDNDQGKDKSENDTIGKREIKTICISPIKSQIVYTFNDKQSGVSNCKDSDEVTFNYRDEQFKNLTEIVKRVTKREDIDSISDALDPNILKMLVGNNKIFDIQINDYLDMLKGKSTSFHMVYDLRNIYDTTLDYEQIEHLNRISKITRKYNLERVTVIKDKFKDRFFGNIKKRIEQRKQEKINAPKKRRIIGFNNKKRFVTKESNMITKIKNSTSNVLVAAKDKLNSSRDFFADKFKINLSPIKDESRSEDKCNDAKTESKNKLNEDNER